MQLQIGDDGAVTTISGKKALIEIDSMLSRARSALDKVEHRYSASRSRHAQVRREVMRVYAELARLRMLAIESGALLNTLDAADHSVSQILEERSVAAGKLDETIQTANMHLAELETRRAEQARRLDAAGESLDSAEGQAQEKLEADPAYQAQLKATEHADFVAEQAEQKAEAAQRDRIDKGRPYEHDPLFSYLWQREFGTSQYAAWPVTRWLDARVADLCEFETARRDYHLLTEIPERLREHATGMRAVFEQEVESLRELEVIAAEAANVPALSSDVEREEEALEVIDSQMSDGEDALRNLVRERVQFASGNDAYYSRCIEILHRAMNRQGLAVLRERAAHTPVPDDDELVGKLAELEDEARRLEQDLVDYGKLYKRESRRLRDFEEVQRRFKSSHFDDSRSEFLDAALFSLVLERLLNGAVSSRDAWKAIRRQQRTRVRRADPRFGTRRFPRAPRSGPWSKPPGGGFGGGFGGGGFGSGGGFGGGGFKSGGGF